MAEVSTAAPQGAWAAGFHPGQEFNLAPRRTQDLLIQKPLPVCLLGPYSFQKHVFHVPTRQPGGSCQVWGQRRDRALWFPNVPAPCALLAAHGPACSVTFRPVPRVRRAAGRSRHRSAFRASFYGPARRPGTTAHSDVWAAWEEDTPPVSSNLTPQTSCFHGRSPGQTQRRGLPQNPCPSSSHGQGHPHRAVRETSTAGGAKETLVSVGSSWTGKGSGKT